MSPALRDLARRARGVGGDHRLEAELADELAALAERMDVALDRLDGLQRRALRRHQVEVDAAGNARRRYAGLACGSR